MTWPTVASLGPPPTHAEFVLEPLGPQHNERDHAAWMGSIEHIRATPGFPMGVTDEWPTSMSLERNLQDLQMHADEFDAEVAYAYSVIDPQTNEVIGCLYVDPDEPADDDSGQPRATLMSWVRADRAELDRVLASTVVDWLHASRAFASVRMPGREITS